MADKTKPPVPILGVGLKSITLGIIDKSQVDTSYIRHLFPDMTDLKVLPQEVFAAQQRVGFNELLLKTAQEQMNALEEVALVEANTEANGRRHLVQRGSTYAFANLTSSEGQYVGTVLQVHFRFDIAYPVMPIQPSVFQNLN